MNDQVLMREVHSLADFYEEAESAIYVELPFVAKLVDWFSSHELHDKISKTFMGFPGIQYVCNVGMIELARICRSARNRCAISADVAVSSTILIATFVAYRRSARSAI